MSSTQQFGRVCQLVVTNQSSAIDLSNLRIRFRVNNADVESPNTATIRVYNAKKETIAAIVKEYTNVVLSAGYTGNLAVIFQGSIMQFVFGKESNIDSFIELRCSDGDALYNFGVVNTSIPAGANYSDKFEAVKKSLDDQNARVEQQQQLVIDAQSKAIQAAKAAGANIGNITSTADTQKFVAAATGGVLARGKVFFGMARVQFRAIANGIGARWSIQNGNVVMIPLTGYIASEAVVVSGATGLIGVPEATDNGVNLRILLNPLVQIGTLLQINSEDITQTVIRQQGYPDYGNIAYAAIVTPGLGLYRVMVAEHTGDTRGTGDDWATEITCLAVDPSSNTVVAY